MPRIQDKFTDIAVYIYPTLADAQLGESFGGCGFIATAPLPVNKDWYSIFIVTNRHVVARAKDPVLRLNRRDGSVECIETRLEQWVLHPYGDDVAVMMLDIEWDQIRFTAVHLENFVTCELVVDEDIGIGDDTVMVGRFVNHDGKQQNAPAVRFGNIAMMNKEPIASKETGVAQESFLVEVRSLPGYSGSAVLLWSPCAINDMSERRFGKQKTVPRMGDLSPEHQFALDQLISPKGPYLLGIDWCHIPREAPIRNRDGNPVQENWYVEENTVMAGVIPAWKIVEVLECEEMRIQRDKHDEEVVRRKRSAAGSPDYAERPTQVTPAGKEIPIPTQDQFLDDLTKATRRVKSEE